MNKKTDVNGLIVITAAMFGAGVGGIVLSMFVPPYIAPLGILIGFFIGGSLCFPIKRWYIKFNRTYFKQK